MIIIPYLVVLGVFVSLSLLDQVQCLSHEEDVEMVSLGNSPRS